MLGPTEPIPVVRDLLAAGAPDTWPGLVEVKRSTVRTVLAGTVHPGLDVHVKLYRAVRWTDQARDLLRGTRARVEFENLRRARARGLPAVEPLAFGVTVDESHRSFLITCSIPGATPLPRGEVPPADAAALGRLLRSVHDAGLRAHDLHPGNIVRDATGGLWLVDLTSARFLDALDIDTRAQALAFFLLDVDRGPLHPSAAPLLAAYGASALLRERTADHWRRLRQRALVAFGRRATRACRHTAVTTVPGARVFTNRMAGDLAERAVAAEPTLDRLPPAKSGRRGAVWLLDGMVAKRRTRAAARRLFRAAYWLGFAGVPCPRPLALVLRRDAGTAFSERLPYPDVAHLLAKDGLTPAAACAAARRLGQALGRLHAHGLRNRDLKLENLVLDPATHTVAMVDLDGVRRRSPADGRARVADLGRLLASFRQNGSPGGTSTLRAFLHGYDRGLQCLDPPRKEARRRSLRATRALRRRIAASASGHAGPGRSTPRSNG